VKTKVEF